MEVTSGLDQTQQRNMNMFYDLQRNIEHERQATGAQRRADEPMQQAGEAAVPQPQQNPAAPDDQAQPPPAEPMAMFDGDDRMCAICQGDFVHRAPALSPHLTPPVQRQLAGEYHS